MTDLPDANVLVSLHAPGHPFRSRAAEWFSSCSSFATTPMTDAGMVRLLTRADVMNGRPVSPADALAMLSALKEQLNFAFWPDGEALDRSSFIYAFQGPGQITDLHRPHPRAQSNAAPCAPIDPKVSRIPALGIRERG